jgi:hypothetical protein
MHKPSPLAWLKLNIMYWSSHRNALQWQSIPGSYINIHACLYSVPQFNVQRSEYITLLPIGIVDQSDPSGPIRVIFNGSYLSRNGDLVPLKIDESEFAFATTATMTHSYHTPAITPGLLLQRNQQGFLGSYSG